MKTLFVTLITSLLFHAAAISQSSEVLTNKSVTSLTSAGMSKKVILSKIQSSKCNFEIQFRAISQSISSIVCCWEMDVAK